MYTCIEKVLQCTLFPCTQYSNVVNNINKYHIFTPKRLFFVFALRPGVPSVFTCPFHRQMISASFTPLFSVEHGARFIERSLHVSNDARLCCLHAASNQLAHDYGPVKQGSGRVVFFLDGVEAVIIAILRRDTKKRFSITSRRREKHFRRAKITRLNWFSLRCWNTRPDRAVAIRIKTIVVLLLGGETIKADLFTRTREIVLPGNTKITLERLAGNRGPIHV